MTHLERQAQQLLVSFRAVVAAHDGHKQGPRTITLASAAATHQHIAPSRPTPVTHFERQHHYTSISRSHTSTQGPLDPWHLAPTVAHLERQPQQLLVRFHAVVAAHDGHEHRPARVRVHALLSRHLEQLRFLRVQPPSP